jgi:site-specific DNA-cytosine methylase
MKNMETISHFHLYCGIGGFAKGFNQGEARLGLMRAQFRCLGGIDVGEAECKDFAKITGAKATCMDLFSRDQYIAFHGHEPPPQWREALPADIRKAARNERPNVVCISAPCKGFSGLLSEKLSTTGRYQALNELALRGLLLTLEAWSDDPPEFYLFENVPRIATRGRELLDQITGLLHQYGYAARETAHDCGELAQGGMGQSRKRFLLVARHTQKIPPHLYEPHKSSLQSIGSVLGRMPLPGDPNSGPMHRVPSLQWKTWVRLAFVTAGSDWRSLNKLAINDGFLKDFAIKREYHPNVLGVTRWDQHMGTITGESGPTNGKNSVADPRYPWVDAHENKMRVAEWEKPARTITGSDRVGSGAMSVGDPRFNESELWNYGHAYGVIPWTKHANTIGGQQSPGQGYYSVADPRPTREKPFRNVFRVVRWDEVGKSVTGGGHPTSGGIGVADPRVGFGGNGQRDAYQTCGHYGVVPWARPSGAVTARLNYDAGWGSVADPRCAHGKNEKGQGRLFAEAQQPADGEAARCEGGAPAGCTEVRAQSEHRAADEGLPSPDERLVAVIQSADKTWHRPLTTLDLAALQTLIEPEEHLELSGLSDREWRERIGNLVPPAAARAIAGVIGQTILLARTGETFILSATPVWVRDVAVAITLAPGMAQ